MSVRGRALGILLLTAAVVAATGLLWPQAPRFEEPAVVSSYSTDAADKVAAPAVAPAPLWIRIFDIIVERVTRLVQAAVSLVGLLLAYRQLRKRPG